MSGITRPIILNETGEDLVRAMNHNTATMLAMNTATYDADGTLLEVQDAREVDGVKHASLGEAVRSLAENIRLGIDALNVAIGNADISVLGDDVTHAIINLNNSLDSLLLLKAFNQNFSIEANSNVNVSVPITIPDDYVIIAITLTCASSYITTTIRGYSASSISILAKNNSTSAINDAKVDAKVLLMKKN